MICEYILHVFLGKTVAMKQLTLQTLNEKTKQCSFGITTSIDDTVPLLTPSYEIFVAITYSVDNLNGKPLSTSNSKVASFQVGSEVGDIMKLTQSGNSFSNFIDVSRVTLQLGVTLIIISTDKKGSYYVTDMFKTNTSPLRLTYVNLTNGQLKLSSEFSAQNNIALSMTTYDCKNTREAIRIILKFNANYDAVVLGKESNFTKAFATFFINYQSTKSNIAVMILNITVSRGSVAVDFYVSILSAEVSIMKDKLLSAVHNGDITFTYGSTVMTTMKTLIINGIEHIYHPSHKFR